MDAHAPFDISLLWRSSPFTISTATSRPMSIGNDSTADIDTLQRFRALQRLSESRDRMILSLVFLSGILWRFSWS